jgi:ribosome-associated heat shock protein Hsp15
MPDPAGKATIRLDKWLWAVRLYKTRSRAIAACHAGHVRIDGQRVKPSRPVRVGEIIEARTGEITRRYRVLEPLERRVGARLVPQYAEDLTPEEEYLRPREARRDPFFRRPKGAGRPTKRDRRMLDRLGR